MGIEARFLSVRTAAIYMDCKPATVRAWVSAGIGAAVRIARRNPKGVGRHRVTLRIDRLRLDRLLESRTR